VDASDTLPARQEDAINHEHEQHGEQNDGLEWEDLMPEINRASEPSNMRWMLIDRESGAENGAIAWAFTVGDRVKIRLVNEMESDHPMHHPFHVHGAGRFLVLSREGEAESNWCGRTPCSFRRVAPWTSSSTSPIQDCGWPTATSPSMLRAG
jgi:FtsP/CotA-like multicopper oxidase with cupredoxin domain